LRESLAQAPGRVLDPRERVRLISGLRAFDGNESSNALIQMVRADPSPEVRTAALTALGDLLDTDELIAVGSRALGDPDLMVRRAAVKLFSKAPANRAFDTLLSGIRLDDDPVLFSGVAELAEEHFQEFAESANGKRPDDHRALLVIKVAQHIRHPNLRRLLPRLAQSGSPEVRESVAELWSRRIDIADGEALEALTMDPVVSVRQRAARAAMASQRYDLLGRMTQDPDIQVRREIAIVIGSAAPVSQAGVALLRRLSEDTEMPVRGAAYVGQLLQGTPLPFPPELDARVAARAVYDAADVAALRHTARTAKNESQRLASGLALALLQDEVAREVAHRDPVPAIRHQVSGALELAIPSDPRRAP
jgi:HEAT repeat protein